MRYRFRARSGSLIVRLSDTVGDTARNIAVLPTTACITRNLCFRASLHAAYDARGTPHRCDAFPGISASAQACTSHIPPTAPSLILLYGQAAMAVEPTNARLVFKAARLESTRQLADYGIHDGAVVHLVLPKRGWLYLATQSSVLEVIATRVDAH